ncbi:uncharacterized protein RBU47_013246 [Passerculus sandwichensis]
MEPCLASGRNPSDDETTEKELKSLEFWIRNSTRNTTLEYRKYDKKSHRPLELLSELLPGHPDNCEIPHEPRQPKTKRLVVYEAKSFTLAIFVHICWEGSKRLQMELSPDKVHLGEGDDLGVTFTRMSKMQDPPDTKTAVTRCELHGRGKVSIWLFNGPYKLMATLSYHLNIQILRVKLEEQEMN